MRIVLALLSALILLDGCALKPPGGGPPPPGTIVAPSGPKPKDVVDKNFVATIAATKTPLVFTIDVSLVNKKSSKRIGPMPVFVDIRLTVSKHRVFAGRTLVRTYAEEIGTTFSADGRKPATSLSGQVRLLRGKLPAGEYTVTPVVRIVETGKGAVHGPYTDFGSVAVPPGNSIRVNLK